MNAFKDVLRDMKFDANIKEIERRLAKTPEIPGYTSNDIIREHYTELLDLLESGEVEGARLWLAGAVKIICEK